MTGRAAGSKRNLTGAETLGISWQVSYDTQMPEQGLRVIEILFQVCLQAKHSMRQFSLNIKRIGREKKAYTPSYISMAGDGVSWYFILSKRSKQYRKKKRGMGWSQCSLISEVGQLCSWGSCCWSRKRLAEYCQKSVQNQRKTAPDTMQSELLVTTWTALHSELASLNKPQLQAQNLQLHNIVGCFQTICLANCNLREADWKRSPAFC